MGVFIDTVLAVLENAWDVFLLLAPLFMIGLLTGGLLYVLISKASIRRMFAREGMASVTRAAAFGVPLPICSCGVVPLVSALRRKGASRSANMSFLITTPETGTDSILVTWGLMGPVMAVVRPIASFVTALMAGILSIGLIREPDRPAAAGDEADHGHHHHDHAHDDHDHSHDPEEDRAVVGFPGLWRSMRAGLRSSWHRVIGWSRLGDWNRPMLDRWERQREAAAAPSDPDAVPFRDIGKRVFTFSFVEMADDILPALVFGILLSGVVMVLVPDDLVRYGLGGGFWAYVLMLLAGVPLYMCASASTPIATALVAKGLSPGAALVFLLTGPATNTATIIVLLKEFGGRFVAIYLGSIVAGAVAAGMALDAALIAFGWEVAVTLEGQEQGLIGAIEWIGAILLLALIVWRFWNGAATQGYRDMTANLRAGILAISGLAKDSRLRSIAGPRSRLVQIGVPLLVLMYLASGFTAVPPGYVGYKKLFGTVDSDGLSPGLHYAPPWPVGTIDVLPGSITHRILVGLQVETEATETVALRNGGPGQGGVSRVDASGMAERDLPASQPSADTPPEPASVPGDTQPQGAAARSGTTGAGATSKRMEPQGGATAGASSGYRGGGAASGGTGLWHAGNEAAAGKSRLAEFLAGDENFVRLLIAVHYRIPDPYAYHYRAAEPADIVAHGVQATAREYIARSNMNDLLSRERTEIEHYILRDLREHLGVTTGESHGSGHTQEHHEYQAKAGRAEGGDDSLGIEVVSVNVVDIHPPPETAAAFREVTGAQIDRETSILEAERSFTLLVPRALGNAQIELQRSRALAEGRLKKAEAEKDSFIARAGSVALARKVLSDLLWFETSERAYAGREIFVLPPGTDTQSLTLWRTRKGAGAPDGGERGKHDKAGR